MGIGAGNIHYNYAQLEGIWQQAGGNPQSAAMAASIAEAESGGNSAAYDNDSNGSIDRGLWQINSVHGAQSTYDVMGNARAAVAISNNGKDWSPWVTYQTGAYQQYLQGNVPANTNTPINATNAAANQPTNNSTQTANLTGCSWLEKIVAPGVCIGSEAVQGATDLMGKTILGIINGVLNPIITLFAGVLGMTAGAVLMLFGIFMIVSQSKTGQGIAGEAVQTGLAFTAPEAESSTRYLSQGGKRETVVTQRRQPGVRFRGTQLRQPTVRTTSEVLRDESKSYVNRSGGAEE